MATTPLKLVELFVACGEAAEVFEAAEAAFDAIALPIEFFVVDALLLAVRFGRYHRDRSHGVDVVKDDLTVVALVGQHSDGFSLSEQFDGLGSAVDLPASDKEVHRETQLVGQQVDLRCQASSGAPQSLVPRPLFCSPWRLLVGSHDSRLGNAVPAGGMAMASR
jgi:hypothetical protein